MRMLRVIWPALRRMPFGLNGCKVYGWMKKFFIGRFQFRSHSTRAMGSLFPPL
jgi:hypothetical protein